MRKVTSFHALFPLVAALALVGCGDKESTSDDGTVTDDGSGGSDSYSPPVDNDGDGYSVTDGDCDDDDATIHPFQAETCDGIDNNCNDVIDEGLDDSDDDGLCDALDTEECDELDNDGDGEIDEDFPDGDGDGVKDCLDEEVCDGVDNNGDGDVDEGFDVDGDGYTSCGDDETEADCDDEDADVNPGATEDTTDMTDNDCDGLIDEGSWEEGDLIITEVMNNPSAVLDPEGEWFEVYNATSGDLILNGLVLSSSIDGDDHTVESSDVLTVGPGEHFVFAISDGVESSNGGVEADYVYTGFTLQNESDEIVITADGVEIDAMDWDDGETMPDPSGASLSLDPWYYSATINDLPSYWCEATEQWSATSDFGSPGEENELCSTFDHDGDGYSKDDGDCDDDDDTVFPGAPELDSSKDNDCDGDVETMPVADADYDASETSLYSCDNIYLDGSGSYDPDSDPLTYEWELTSAPSTSARTTADIVDTTDVSPVFNADVPGDYTFALTVNDGGTDSYTDTLTLTISSRPDNTNPTADAGDDQSESSSVTCTAISYGESYSCSDCDDFTFALDGSDSSDADGDTIEGYLWEVESGSSYASIDDSSSSTPTVTVTGVSATYGETNSVEVVLKLTVTDCYGGTGSDLVQLSAECTGS